MPEIKRARIEIVPMIDTIFFLLVFFMIASLSMVPLKSRHVSLPESETANQKPQNQVVLTAASDGALFLDRTRCTEPQLLAMLRGRVQSDPNVTVLINCDKALPASHFLRLFDLAKQADAAKVMVATLPRNLGAQRP
ncbi:biopolymer transporter ExbD [Capsulimonas corticalis]|uniref:Biopolymer transporter ExbD n=2 Tax=Capsulimonas corticalis TaxID=2219043 RepID=A0A9N7QDD6_9BACT|nr:biopolymer transporter ExbD [Capsulimonas corticalis]